MEMEKLCLNYLKKITKNHKMKKILLILFLPFCVLSQNQNLSSGLVFDGEPYITINPNNSQHMVVAWMGYKWQEYIVIKTKVTFDAGQSWSSENYIPHINPVYGSADPSLEFDNNGNLFLCYIDFSAAIDSGAIYVVKSVDGGLNWQNPVEVINAHSDPGKYPVDRPWISIDKSGGVNDGAIYITSMNPNVFGPLSPPYNPYFMYSDDGGNTFSNWRYLDTTGFLAGSLITQPMPTNCVSSNGTFHAIFPSYVPSQNIYAQFILASSTSKGNSFNYNIALQANSGLTDTLMKKGNLLISNPSDENHLVMLFPSTIFSDEDIVMIESFDEGISWSNPIRINDDNIGNGKMQDLVWADFDSDGDLVITWRDRRNSSANGYQTESEIWGSVRWKDSTNFSSNFSITSQQIAYDTILAESGNDFMCVAVENDTLNAVWGDTRNGKLNIYFQRMSLQSGSVTTVTNISENKNKKLLFLVDEMGRKVNKQQNVLLFYIFDDGTVEKRLNVAID